VMDYAEFLERKRQLGSQDGFDPVFMPDFLFDFQKSLTDWAIRKGRAAIFADCGMGKTPMQLVWAENVVRKTKHNVLILTPLAVSAQTIREGEKFGIKVSREMPEKDGCGIVIANYERLHYFTPEYFSGVVCDESSILKSFDGVTKAAVTVFMKKIPYRLLCTATAAPNDYIELGTSSEALGGLGYIDMLNRFFKNDLHNSATGRYHGEVIKWRLKGHAEIPFWRWVSSWARALRRPSDLGFNDDGFILPPLIEEEHIIEVRTNPEGMLFNLPAIGLKEQREEKSRTVTERCEKAAELIGKNGRQSLVWCHLNREADLLEKIIPNGKQISGGDTDDVKEELFTAFASGQLPVLITKPKIGAWGLNLQKCSHITFFPSHSYEQYYQGIRRCWRFGQKNPVKVDIIGTRGDQEVIKNLRRKAEGADRMFSSLVAEMNNAVNVEAGVAFNQKEVVPLWL